jgi:hypothetical protein
MAAKKGLSPIVYIHTQTRFSAVAKAVHKGVYMKVDSS